MALDGLRGYAQAASDLSGIARARVLDVVRDLVRSEVERVSPVIGLAPAEEVAELRRTVERLEHRLAALEDATRSAPAGPATKADGEPAAPPSAASRPARRPSAARSRTGGPRTGTGPTSEPTPSVTPGVTPVKRPRAVADAAQAAAEVGQGPDAPESPALTGTDEGSAS